MDTIKTFVKRTPVIRELVSFLLRFKIVSGYFTNPLGKVIVWLFRSKEMANFTYDLSETNKRYLAALISEVTGEQHQTIMKYLAELENNPELRSHIRSAILSSEERFFADLDVHYGRRLGWYALVRVMKPKVVVETGVDKGMGSCILISALMKNEQDGYPGYYYGTDINLKAGYLITGEYKKYGEVLYGDSIETLKKLQSSVDIFINDSDHSPDYEAREYEIISTKLSKRAIILGDNSHVTDKLLNFALVTGRQFVFFREEPLNHWYSGAGIGIAYWRAVIQEHRDALK